MKKNMKNFPRFEGSIAEYLDAVIPWKIGFEAELREFVKDIGTRPLEGKSSLAMFQKFKEILGE